MVTMSIETTNMIIDTTTDIMTNMIDMIETTDMTVTIIMMTTTDTEEDNDPRASVNDALFLWTLFKNRTLTFHLNNLQQYN